MIPRIFAGIGGVVLESLAVWELLVAGQPVAGFAAHALACFLLVVWGAGFTIRIRQIPGAEIWLWGVMLPAPVIGPFCGFLLMAAVAFIPAKVRAEDRVVLGVPGNVAAAAPADPAARTRSILAVLASPDKLTRREAVLSLRSEISPAAVLILQKAVGDSDEHVRNYAQSQLAKWTEQAEERIKRLSTMASSPEATPIVLLALAESLSEMVAIHLTGRELEEKYLRLAVSFLERIPSGCPERRNADLLAVPCNLKIRRPAAAREAFTRLEMSGYHHESIDGLRLRILFHERDWSSLRDAWLMAIPDATPEITRSRGFWNRSLA